MKKNIILFSVLATMLFILPHQVYAVAFVDNDNDGVYENNESIPAGQFGTIAAGDFTWRYEDSNAGKKRWTISFDTSSSYIYFSLVPNAVSIDSVSVSGTGFALFNQDKNSDGSVDVMIESANSGSSRVTITVMTIDTADTGCTLNISPYNLNCSVNVPGIYFDDNGNVITEEEYNQVCGNTTTTPNNPNDIPNSQTGSVVPYVAIGGGVVAIIVVYLLSRKSNKVYKI